MGRLTAVLAALLVGAAILVPAAPASAGAAPCNAGSLCVWDEPFSQGWFAPFYDRNRSWHTLNSGWSRLADHDQTWCNFGTSGRHARVWENPSWGGRAFALAVGVCLTDPTTTWPADKGSSNDWPFL